MAIFKQNWDFLLGVADLRQLPNHNGLEVAFAGRSNVGKSSLLNALTGRKKLARTSNTPGRTQQINFFHVEEKIFIADMPGYGYARESKSKVAEWNKLIRKYLRGRAQLRRVFVLIDSRHGVKQNDLEIMEMLDEAAVSYQLVYTKMDKLRASDKILVNVDYKKHAAMIPDIIFTSSEKGDGIDDLQKVIEDLM